jgi:hypothetical protein
MLAHARFVEEFQLGEDTKTYLFERADGTPVAVLWSYDMNIDRGQAAPQEASIPLPSAQTDWSLKDMMGNPAVARKIDQHINFTVSGHPVYLVGTGSSVQAMQAALRSGRIGDGGIPSAHVTFSLDRPDGATLNVANKLLRRIEGHFEVRSATSVNIDAELDLPPLEQTKVSLPIPKASAGRLSELRLETTVNDYEVEAQVRQSHHIEYFMIPRLPDGVSPNNNSSIWQNVPAYEVRANAEPDTASDTSIADLTAQAKLGWRDDGLYLRISVDDDTFVAADTIAESESGDSLKLYLDVYADGINQPDQGYDESDHEILIANIQGRGRAYRQHAPAWQVGFVRKGVAKLIDVDISTHDSQMVYLIHMPVSQFQPIRFESGASFGFALAVVDRDAGNDSQTVSLVGNRGPFENRPEVWPIAILGDSATRRSPQRGTLHDQSK